MSYKVGAKGQVVISKELRDRLGVKPGWTVVQRLVDGQDVKISGFGNFQIRTKAPRPGRNPRTGELIPIAARRVVTFHASSKLKELIQGEGTGS